MTTPIYKCWDCGKPLPPGGAGKCAKCSWLRENIAPHCPFCKTALNYWPDSKMAIYNQKCKCARKEAA
jgi:hypothetical protein